MKKMYFKPAVSVVDIQNKDGFLLPEASVKNTASNVLDLKYGGAGGDIPAVARRQDKLWDYDDEEEEE